MSGEELFRQEEQPLQKHEARAHYASSDWKTEYSFLHRLPSLIISNFFSLRLSKNLQVLCVHNPFKAV